MDMTMQQDFRYVSTMIIKPVVAAAILAAYFAGIFGPF